MHQQLHKDRGIWRVFKNFPFKIFQRLLRKVTSMWTRVVLHQNDTFCQQSWSLGLNRCTKLNELIKIMASSNSVLPACFRIDNVRQTFQQNDSFLIPKQCCHHFARWKNFFKLFRCGFCRSFPHFAYLLPFLRSSNGPTFWHPSLFCHDNHFLELYIMWEMWVLSPFGAFGEYPLIATKSIWYSLLLFWACLLFIKLTPVSHLCMYTVPLYHDVSQKLLDSDHCQVVQSPCFFVNKIWQLTQACLVVKFCASFVEYLYPFVDIWLADYFCVHITQSFLNFVPISFLHVQKLNHHPLLAHGHWHQLFCNSFAYIIPSKEC